MLSLTLGIAHELGYRGFTYALLFAITVGALGAWAARGLRTSRATAFVLMTLARASQGLLDMLTNGSNGIALL